MVNSIEMDYIRHTRTVGLEQCYGSHYGAHPWCTVCCSMADDCKGEVLAKQSHEQPDADIDEPSNYTEDVYKQIRGKLTDTEIMALGYMIGKAAQGLIITALTEVDKNDPTGEA